MVTWQKTLTYVKANLALPSTFIENTDNQIKEYLNITALSEFSSYFPDWERVPVYPADDHYQVSGKTTQYYFYDEEDLDIIGIKDCYFQMDNEVFSGHPLVGPYSMEHYKWFSLAVFKSKLFKKYSDFDRVFKFIQPNIIEIFPANLGDNSFVVEYERKQPEDLSKIPQALEMIFMDLCLAHQMIKIGNLRSMYGDGNIDTPFGNIPLNGENLRQRGEDLRTKIVDIMKEESIPDMLIEVD